MIEFIHSHQVKFLFENKLIHHIVFSCLNIAIFVSVTWLALKLSDAIIDRLIVALKKKDSNNILLRFMPILRKVTKIILVLVFLMSVLQLYGFSVSTLVAGIGVGGVVFGLAAQKTIINVLGSVSLIVDNAYKVSDYVRINISINGKDIEGTVEDISLRSTKIRCLDGTLVNVPNGSISDGVVQNYSHMKKRLFSETINLTYSVTNEQIEQAKQLCHDVLNNHPNVSGNFSIELISLNSYSVDLQVLADIYPIGLYDFYKVENDLLSEIYSKFNENGIDFAFPTQTIELKQ